MLILGGQSGLGKRIVNDFANHIGDGLGCAAIDCLGTETISRCPAAERCLVHLYQIQRQEDWGRLVSLWCQLEQYRLTLGHCRDHFVEVYATNPQPVEILRHTRRVFWQDMWSAVESLLERKKASECVSSELAEQLHAVWWVVDDNLELAAWQQQFSGH